mmetsp:Transcript_56756/g.61502  ORF Transcript_56756/g.61502 Transcript_56756/m.61502 type:complete len:135 (+) Transcript_56756:33-437(+)
MIKNVLFRLISLSFAAAATEAFSQTLEIQKRNSINCPSLQEKHIGNTQQKNYLSNNRRPQRTIKPIDESEDRLTRSTSTTLRGGFFLPTIMNDNPLWNVIGIYAISDFSLFVFGQRNLLHFYSIGRCKLLPIID